MRLALSILALALALLPGACGRSAPARANLVVIVVDTLRADHADPALGLASTPALDALAADGVRFTEAFSHAPMTLPAHVSLLTSRLPFVTGIRLNAQPVPEGLPLLTGWLRRYGYDSSAVVSLASLWPIVPDTGLDRGFSEYVYDGQVDCWAADRVDQELAPLLERTGDGGQPFFLLAHYSDPHDPYSAHGTTDRRVELRLDGELVERLNASEFAFRSGTVELAPGQHTLELTGAHPFRLRLLEPRGPQGVLPLEWIEGGMLRDLQHARATLTNPGDAPVACDLWLWLQDVLSEDENRARYRLEVEFADRMVGRFLDELRRRGLYDESLIVFLSDHGEALGEHGHTGHVVNLYDELLHVPLVIKPPKGHARLAALQAASQQLVRMVDIAPTLLELLDLPPMPGQQGHSVLTSGPQMPLLAETHPPMAPRELFALRDERFKLVFHPQADRFEMYDLASDPRELTDVFAERGPELAEWQRELRRIAQRAAELGTTAPVLDAEAARRLKALGY
jgi:arylsulfatase A-like enzyme